MSLSVSQGSFSEWESHKTNHIEQHLCQPGPLKCGWDFQILSIVPLSPPLSLLWNSPQVFSNNALGDTHYSVCVSSVHWMANTALLSYLKWSTQYSSSHRLSHSTSLSIQDLPLAFHLIPTKAKVFLYVVFPWSHPLNPSIHTGLLVPWTYQVYSDHRAFATCYFFCCYTLPTIIRMEVILIAWRSLLKGHLLTKTFSDHPIK